MKRRTSAGPWLDGLLDPDDIGATEYRAIVDALRDQDESRPHRLTVGLADAMLEQFISYATDLRRELNAEPRAPRRA